jgi:hypothetical protein
MLVAPHARRRQDELLLRADDICGCRGGGEFLIAVPDVVLYEAKSAGHRGTQRTGRADPVAVNGD